MSTGRARDMYGAGIIVRESCISRLHAARCSIADTKLSHATVLPGSSGHARSSPAKGLPAAGEGGFPSSASQPTVSVKTRVRRCSHWIHSGVRKLPSVCPDRLATRRGYGS